VRIIIECPESILHIEAGYIYADCPFAQLQTSCSPAADHTISTVNPYESCESWRQEEWSTLTRLWCSGIRFRLSVVSYLIATAIWYYRLRRAADWAWGSVTNADAPLAYELAAALACRGHLGVSSLRNGNWNRSKLPNSLCLAELTVGTCWMPHKRGGVGTADVQLHRFNKRPASRIRHSVGSNQEYQSLLGSAITLRLLALTARSPVTDQSETKPTARQWL